MIDEKTLTFDIKIKGDDNEVIGSIEKQINIHYDSNIHRQILPLGFKQNHSLYSILACNYADDNIFQLSIESSSYCKETEDTIVEALGVVTNSVIEKLSGIPTIVLRPSKEAKDEYAMYGFITSIKRNANLLVMNFFLLTKIPLKLIYKEMELLGIRNSRLNNSLEKEMYSFHAGDLSNILCNLGIELPAL